MSEGFKIRNSFGVPAERMWMEMDYKGVEIDGTRPSPLGRCSVCDQEMSLPLGYGETGLCGPCATGESETLEEYGETW